jgi:hypothetical protein
MINLILTLMKRADMTTAVTFHKVQQEKPFSENQISKIFLWFTVLNQN